jgi:hypothetical protein
MKSVRQKSVDIMTLKLSPEEGFVLSRVEGTATVKELAALTGFDEDRVLEIVERLGAQGAVEIGEPAPAAASLRPANSPVEAELMAFLSDAPAALEEEPPLQEGDESATEDEEPEDSLEREGDVEYRKLYETVYHPMTKDERVKAASEAAGSHLMALCLDADPQVITALLANGRVGLPHARYIAQHHRTQIGLDAVAKRTEFLSDAWVQRRLLRNPQLPTTLLGRILNPKMLLDVYKVAIDREIPERTRVMTRESLRKKFMLSSSDEKASLLFKTEGRCLLHLTSCSLDAHATQILSSKQNFTNMFVQNVARWSASPPQLLAHLLKNPVVRRNMGLKKMLLRHPNMPSDAKRGAV